MPGRKDIRGGKIVPHVITTVIYEQKLATIFGELTGIWTR
jgi:hypothetical protein